MNGRCHNDPMDFAEDVCDSCGSQFCIDCLVFPRGPKGPPYCTSCAMALSGVRNRRPAQTRSRSEIRRRRKELRAQLATRDASEKIELPGTELINGPQLDPETAGTAPGEHKPKTGLIHRFRRRGEHGHEPVPAEDDPTVLPEFGGAMSPETESEGTVAAMDRETDFELTEGTHTPTPAERSSAAALLEQLRDHDSSADDDVWLPPVRETPTAAWTMPEVDQTPLVAGGPWGALAAEAQPASSPTPEPPTGPAGASPPVFVSEAQLRAQGPADTDHAGNWVPPSLRGIAPDAHRSASALPRRRRRTAEEADEPDES